MELDAVLHIGSLRNRWCVLSVLESRGGSGFAKQFPRQCEELRNLALARGQGGLDMNSLQAQLLCRPVHDGEFTTGRLVSDSWRGLTWYFSFR